MQWGAEQHELVIPCLAQEFALAQYPGGQGMGVAEQCCPWLWATPWLSVVFQCWLTRTAGRRPRAAAFAQASAQAAL